MRKIEEMKEGPFVDTSHGGAATLDDLENVAEDFACKLNQVIRAINDLEASRLQEAKKSNN